MSDPNSRNAVAYSASVCFGSQCSARLPRIVSSLSSNRRSALASSCSLLQRNQLPFDLGAQRRFCLALGHQVASVPRRRQRRRP